MPCYHPRIVWRSPRHVRIDSGKPRIFFRRPRLWYSSARHVAFYEPEEFSIPGCKPKCVGCVEEYSRAWAVRAWHEASLSEANAFVTLTYSEEFVPSGLIHRDFQLFIKRLRKYLSEGVGQAQRVRYLMCGEYGSVNDRPHFHVLIFGFDFPDRVLWSERSGVKLYRSELLDKLWMKGFASVGDLTFESASYVARYTGKKAANVDRDYGDRRPEYAKMSLKPGIGADWFLAFKDSVYPHDYVVMRGGRKCKPPRYYDKKLMLTDPDLLSKLKAVRKDTAVKSQDNSPERLKAREVVKMAQFSQLKRSL